MRLLGLVIGALVILGSAISFAAPDLRLSLERSVKTPAGLYAIAALRIAIGLVFVLAAPASQAPRTLRVLGLIVILAGLTTPFNTTLPPSKKVLKAAGVTVQVGCASAGMDCAFATWLAHMSARAASMESLILPVPCKGAARWPSAIVLRL